MPSKVCPKCGKFSECYVEKTGKLSSYCKICTKVRNREYKKNNPEKFSKYRETFINKYREVSKDPEYNKMRYKKQKDRQIGRNASARLTITGRSQCLVDSARTRARNRGVEFSLSRDYVEGLFEKQQNRCLLTGIEFDLAPTSGTRLNPYSPSLDRIDRSRGYTEDNVRLILTCVNLSINEWGDEVLNNWVSAYFKGLTTGEKGI